MLIMAHCSLTFSINACAFGTWLKPTMAATSRDISALCNFPNKYCKSFAKIFGFASKLSITL